MSQPIETSLQAPTSGAEGTVLESISPGYALISHLAKARERLAAASASTLEQPYTLLTLTDARLKAKVALRELEAALRIARAHGLKS